MKNNMLKTVAVIAVIIFSPASTYLVFADGKPNSGISQMAENHTVEKASDKKQTGSLTANEIIRATDRFMNILVQKSDENYRVIGLQSKQALLNKFSDVATAEAARTFVDFFYTEKNDGLYIKPTETPPWFNKGNPYEMEQISPTHYLVKQKNKSSLHGNYSITLDFKRLQDNWKITGVSYK
ncbi:hypothetical protein P5G51_007525 [Virgibacillus sp. 179-BFC.A HS]|uniref:DUF3993 domain-containing protein n=1 Tax=Tigheibacillus jepli TaxID=3035914 RepID=A0ABU5CG32_9BACI|nr:hypothetical protein [Virgibacillus sp. 179-BFC.A HS]MDY0405274.1 hypothetical protein [Virgibacillus sp. 179-BFC.A HS]